MQFEGQIRKMMTENGNPIKYYWNFKNDFIVMNQLLGKKIKISFDHYECLGCGLDKEIYLNFAYDIEGYKIEPLIFSNQKDNYQHYKIKTIEKV